MKKVFTFWEPKEKVPGYVRLCMDTWKDCLPGYETVVLDYGTLGDWLTPEEQRAILCRKMTLAMQSDCIRCAVLKKHGGVWMDADTDAAIPADEPLGDGDNEQGHRQVQKQPRCEKIHRDSREDTKPAERTGNPCADAGTSH